MGTAVVDLVDVAPTPTLADELHGVAHVVDVARPDEMEHVAEAAADAEVVCLNAGIVGSSLGVPWEVPAEEWHRLLDVNVLGIVNGLRAFLPRLSARRDASRIIITGSLAGLVTFPGGGAVTLRAERLASGRPPLPPAPGTAAGPAS